MKIIREHINLFRQQVIDRLVVFLKKNGKCISFKDFSECPIITTSEGVCTVDSVSLTDAIGFNSIYVEYSDEYRNFGSYIDNISIEELISIVECLELYEEDICQTTEDEAVGLLSEAYYEIFGEENGQLIRVDDINIILENGVQIVTIGDWNGSGIKLLDDNKIDYWDKISVGEKLSIAQKVYTIIMTEE